MPLGVRVSACSLILALASLAAAAQNPDVKNPYTIPPTPPTLAKHAMVVSIDHYASDAGLQILKAGGNAVDAAVAVGFALAVVYPQAGNIGGGGFMLIRMKSGPHQFKAHFIDYREEAPSAASPNMYLDSKGNVIPRASTLGGRAIGVPGTVAGLVYAEKTYGKLTLKQVMAPAIQLATEGFHFAPEEARTMQRSRNLASFPDSRHLFQRDGNFYQPDELFVQSEFAQTLTLIAADPSTFYTGSMAAQIAAAVQKRGGLITPADLAAYKVHDRAPLVGAYRGYQIITSPPPSSGGVTLLEALNIVSGYHLPAMGDRTPQQIHLLVEAYRRAFMDRNAYLGDPGFISMPLKAMLSPAYAATWRKTIDPVAPTPSATLQRPSGFLPPPPTAGSVAEPTQTTQFSVVDAQGNAVSNTYTLNGFYGSGVLAGSLGFVLNNEMDDFTSKPGVPNMFGLIQGPANAIEPHKRPLSSMTPTMVTRNGKLLLVLGSPGGSTIITTVANDIVSILDNRLNVQAAADAPRFHHQFLPDRIEIEKAFPVTVANTLQAIGYTVNRNDVADGKDPGVWGDSEMIYVNPRTHTLEGADDQRHHFGKAAGY